VRIKTAKFEDEAALLSISRRAQNAESELKALENMGESGAETLTPPGSSAEVNGSRNSCASVDE
jgi:hypothetical protein